LLVRKKVIKLSTAIQEVIDKICDEDNYEITYAEINAAMITIMTDYNNFELRELWKETNS
jgi:hypothetical protein